MYEAVSLETRLGLCLKIETLILYLTVSVLYIKCVCEVGGVYFFDKRRRGFKKLGLIWFNFLPLQ